MEVVKLDEIDLKILNLLQFNARSSKSKIAQAVNLSEALCWARVLQMEASGIITSFSALIDREKLGFHFQAFIHINAEISDPALCHHFQQMISASPEVVGFYKTDGEFNYFVEVVTKSVKDFHRFIEQDLKRHACTKRINSSVVLSAMKIEPSRILPQP